MDVQRQADLLQVVLALKSPGRLARRLHGRQEQRDQYPDNRDNDQEFYKREAAFPCHWSLLHKA